MPALQLFLLGTLEIWHEGQQLPKPPTLKSQSLLAYLAIHHQQPQSRERLADLFWGDRPERRARRSLTTALWHIRRCLPSTDLLLCDAHTVQFNPQTDLWLDVAEFETQFSSYELLGLQSAVTLYRGDFLDGFYDDWVFNERYRLETLYSDALARLMAELEQRREYASALSVGMRLLRHDPLREDAHRLVMRAYCHLGQRNTALEQYRRCQQIVKQELDAEPMVETVELFHAIRDGRFSAEPAVEAFAIGDVGATSTISMGQNPLDPVDRYPLVGRKLEMAFLLNHYAEAQKGHGGLVLVNGEAGMGKTLLVEELASRLRWQGVRVLWGRCYEFERILPYQPFGEVLQSVLSSMSPEDLADLPAWVLDEMARLVPELSEVLPGLSANSAVLPEKEQVHLFEGVTRFLTDLSAEGALVLILDDLHWASESTLQLIHYLARHVVNHSILMVGTLRPEAIDPQHNLYSFKQQLSHEGLMCSINLAGLSAQAIEGLVVEMSGSGEAVIPLAHRLYIETEGNPFFLMETIKALFEAGLISLNAGMWSGDFANVSLLDLPLPSGLSQAIQARLQRLDHDARQALQVAAVLGCEFDFELLNAAWVQDEEATLEVIDMLLRRRFIKDGSGVLGRDYAFHHHKIREVVYTGIPLKRRRRLHARVGKAMEKLYESNLPSLAGELAFHFDQGRQIDLTLVPKAVCYLLLSGDQARLAYAHREAIEYYTQALALQEQVGEYEQAGRTLMKLGLAYHTGFDFAQARKAFERGFIQWQHAGKQEPRISQPSAPHALRIRWRNPYTLDPCLCDDYVSSLVIDQMFRGLVSTDAELVIEPEVAQSWEVSEAGRRYRFHLYPNARWSDGSPLTAHDFEYAWKRVLDPATGVDATMWFVIKGGRAYHQGERADSEAVGVRALDDFTLDVVLEEPTSHFLYMLADVSAYPVPQHIIATHGASWTNADRIVSNGPFQLEAWEQGNFMSLKRNPFYTGRRWGNLDQVVLHFPQDLSTQDLSIPLKQYAAGDLDVLTLTDASVHEGDYIRRQFSTEYVSAPWLFTIYLGFVTSQPPFNDPRLRQALALGADREELANVVLRGMFTPGTGGLVPPGMPGYSAQIGLAYDPHQAQQLLDEAGFSGSSGLPTLEALTVPPIDPLITHYLQAQWQANLGIQVAWEVADWPPFTKRLLESPPHLFILAKFASWPDPVCILASDDSIREYTRWTNQDFITLTEKAGRTLDQGVRIELLRQADQLLTRDAAIIPLFYGRQHVLVKPWVRSFPISALNRWYWQNAIIEFH